MSDGMVVNTIADVRAGLRVECDATLIPPGACAEGENVVVENGTIRTRPGRAWHGAAPGDGLRALAAFAHGDSGAPTARLVGVAGDRVYVTETADQRFDGARALDTTVDSGHRTRMAQFNDHLYLVDGVNLVRRWNPADGTRVEELADKAAPTTAPTATENAAAAYLGDFTVGSDTGLEANDVTPWTKPNWFNVKDLGGEALGVCTRLFDNDRGDGTPIFTSGHAQCLGLELISVRQDHLGTQAWMIQELPSSVQLQYADTLTLRLYASTGVHTEWMDSLKLEVHFGETLPGAIDTVTELEHKFTVTFNHAQYEDYTNRQIEKTIDISALDPATRDAIKYVAIKVVRCDLSPNLRSNFGPGVYIPEEVHAVTLFIDAIEANVTEPTFIEGGQYELTYTYGYDVDGAEVESNPYQATDAESDPFPLLTVTEHTMGLKISCAYDAAAAPDRLHLYARGGASAEFRRIHTFEKTAEAFVYDWDGRYEVDMAYMEPYVSRPVAGCSLLLNRNGRMCYAKDDILYLSNWDHPERAPSADIIVEMSGEYGGWVKVGMDGQPITGLGALGPYLLVFKAQGVWALVGNDASDFALKALSDHAGCASHETIQSLDGNALAWLAPDGRVWAWDGERFTDLGEAITPLLQAHPGEALAAAFAVYDPQQRWYVLTVPGAAGAASYCFALRSRSWMPAWTGQPGACALYAAQAATPGVYAGDATGLYRQHTGTTDATGEATAVPIRWRWFSKMFRDPFPLQYKAVQQIIAWVAGTGGPVALTLHLRANGGPDSATKTITADLAPQQPRQAQWRPPLLPDLGSYQIGLAAESATAVEVPRIDIVLTPRGRVR